MKDVKWLIEADVFEDNTDKLIQTLKDKNYKYHILKYVPFDDDLADRCLKIYGPDECVIFYGSLNFGKKLRKLPWVPGVYLNEKAFECTSYYPILGPHIVHSNYVMLPYGDLIRRKDDLYTYFNDDKIFIRPNSGNKQFTGMVVEKYNFDDCVKLAGFYDVEPDLLVVVSNVCKLDQEWRFVIVDGKVISGSLYRDWSKPEKISPGSVTRDYVLMNSYKRIEECFTGEFIMHDKYAWNAAQNCADKYNPDHCWTIDVAKTMKGTYEILEVGCFSCAGMYGNNLEIIVDKVSEAALTEWKEYNE
jgi:hypothetical protein